MAGLKADETKPSAIPIQAPNCRNGVQQVLRQTFRYDPTVRQKAEVEGLLGEDVIRLEPHLVTETKVNPYVVRHFAHQRELLEANKPSLTNGAAISGPRVSVGLMPYKDLFPSAHSTTPRCTLINIRW